MALCNRWGIPHSQFLGRVVGPGDPLWTAEDRDKAIAFDITERQACPNCGLREEDSKDEFGRPHDPPLFEPVVHCCDSCRERTRLRQRLEEEARATYGEDEQAGAQIAAALAGHYVVMEPFDPDREIAGEG